jgi:hypothetical protein
MLSKKNKKVTYKTFITQILYMSKNKDLNAKEIRKCLKLSYSKGVIPSLNVRKALYFLKLE